MKKELFPIFNNYPNLVFLDNASTTQKPTVVIEALKQFYTKYNANVHRGLYPLSEHATEVYEEARVKIAKFINAQPEEIIFTAGTTASINGLATSLYSSKLIGSKPKILLSDSEHHSNILPWQQIPEAVIDYLESENGTQIYKEIHVRDFYDIVSLNYVSNVTGYINDVSQLRDAYKNTYFILDIAQAVGHMPIDVQKLGVDFVTFSGHKMYGPMGIGVLWGKKEHLLKMNPFTFGGGMIREVKRNYSTWANIPNKFEAGTPSVADAYGLGVAVDFLNSIGLNNIEKKEHELRKYLIKKLSEIEHIKIYHPDLNTKAGGVASISFDEAHPHDIAQYLGDREICTRAGHHCTQILHREVLQIPASLRISLGIYNSIEDINKLITTLKQSLTIYKKR